MSDINGFRRYLREDDEVQDPTTRVRHFGEFYHSPSKPSLKRQASRCMDCGVPFCQSGCPLGNRIPDWNKLVAEEDWKEALAELHATNNFPEITGRVCPAPCETTCVLGLNFEPVTIKSIEREIIERGFEEGWVKAKCSARRSGFKIAIIGSGPAGLAAAEQLNAAGHEVVIFERDDRAGGLLRYGIPDFKLEKWVIDRRLELLNAAGIEIRTGVEVGVDVQLRDLASEFDAVVLATGAILPKDVLIPGRSLRGIHFAMEYLVQQNRRVAGDGAHQVLDSRWFGSSGEQIDAYEKHVIVIGGGDTGADCVGTANRQGAKSVTQFQYRPAPVQGRSVERPWPFYPATLSLSSSHEEGCNREWKLLTKEFIADGEQVSGLRTVALDWSKGQAKELEASEQGWEADLVLIAIGYQGPETPSWMEGLERTERGTIWTDGEYRTTLPRVYCCGDMRRGQSLVVWAISEGREAARIVDRDLMQVTSLPTNGPIGLQVP